MSYSSPNHHLIPQIVMSKRYRRQLKNGEMTPSDLQERIERDRDRESKEIPQENTGDMMSISSRSSRSSSRSYSYSSLSPPLSPPDSPSDSKEKYEKKKVRFEKDKEKDREREKEMPFSSPSSSQYKKNMKSNSNSFSQNKTKSSQSPHSHRSSSPQTDLAHQSFSAAILMIFFIVFLLLSDQYLTDLYRDLSPKHREYGHIPFSSRFFDSRILSTGIISPINGEITTSSKLSWWIDGALLAGNGDPSVQRNIILRLFLDDREIQFPQGNTFNVTLEGKV